MPGGGPRGVGGGVQSLEPPPAYSRNINIECQGILFSGIFVFFAYDRVQEGMSLFLCIGDISCKSITPLENEL